LFVFDVIFNCKIILLFTNKCYFKIIVQLLYAHKKDKYPINILQNNNPFSFENGTLKHYMSIIVTFIMWFKINYL